MVLLLTPTIMIRYLTGETVGGHLSRVTCIYTRSGTKFLRYPAVLHVSAPSLKSFLDWAHRLYINIYRRLKIFARLLQACGTLKNRETSLKHTRVYLKTSFVNNLFIYFQHFGPYNFLQYRKHQLRLHLLYEALKLGPRNCSQPSPCCNRRC